MCGAFATPPTGPRQAAWGNAGSPLRWEGEHYLDGSPAPETSHHHLRQVCRISTLILTHTHTYIFMVRTILLKFVLLPQCHTPLYHTLCPPLWPHPLWITLCEPHPLCSTLYGHTSMSCPFFLLCLRYSAVRRQFGPTPSEELPVLEYQLQVG